MNIAIIAAAGSGTRMASDRPKQFLLLAGTPVICHTLKVFEQCDSIHEVIVVLPAVVCNTLVTAMSAFLPINRRALSTTTIVPSSR